MEDFIVTANHSEAKRQIALQMRQEMTPSERLLWQHLRASRLAGLHFRRQQIIEGFIADFYCHAARLVVELDGAVHESRGDYDTERDQILANRGLFVLRFSNVSTLSLTKPTRLRDKMPFPPREGWRASARRDRF